MTLARGAMLGVLGVALAWLDATDTCTCTPPLRWGVVYGSVSRAGSPVEGAVVEVEVFPEGCEGGQQAFTSVQEPAPTDGDGRYRAQVTAYEPADAACVGVTAHAAAGDGLATGGPLGLRTSATPDSVRVDVAIP